MNADRFRWRDNPAVIAQFFNGEDIPQGVDVHLRPNEACAVVEEGEVVGVATATRMTLNPKLGTLARLMGKREKFRTFMFAHTGPHEVLVQLKGTWKDGSQALGMAGLKIQFNQDDLAKLLKLPADGKMTITLGDLAQQIQQEVQVRYAGSHMALTHRQLATSDQATVTVLEAGLRQVAQPALGDIGATLQRLWISWTPSDHERLVAMQNEVEFMAKEGRLLAEKDRLEMERMLAEQSRALEIQHQLNLKQAEFKARDDMQDELARIRAKSQKEKAQWDVLTKRDEMEAENLRRRTELTAQQDDLKATLDHENRIKGLDRTMEFEDKEEELKFKREMRDMDRARRRAGFVQEMEKKAAKHNNELLKDTFDAMDGDDTE